MTRVEQIALWVSRIGHPFVLPLAALLIVTLQVVPPPQAILITILMAITLTAPVLLYTRRQVRGRRWTDYDVSVRTDRYRLYPLILIVCLLSALVFWLVGAPAFILRGIAAGTSLAFIAMLINLRLKISLHAALAMECAVVILALVPWLGMLACGFGLLIGWSRVVLRRHTALEVLSGGLLGIIIGAVLVLSG